MQLNTYLMFKGECKEAFEFYAKVLDGKIEAMITHAGTPAEAHTPPEWRDKIMHARLSVGDSLLMASDAPPGRQDQGASGFFVNIGIEDPEAAERIFSALAENGTIRMPFQQTFWTTRFGMLVDRFGTPWMINCE